MFNRLSFSLLPPVRSMLTMKGLATVCWKELKCNAKVILHWELYYTLGVHALDFLILSYSLTQLHQNHYHLMGKLNFPLSTSVNDDFFADEIVLLNSWSSWQPADAELLVSHHISWLPQSCLLGLVRGCYMYLIVFKFCLSLEVVQLIIRILNGVL